MTAAAGVTARLQDLVAELRARGVRAGVGELLAAHRALAAIDAGDREEAYYALRAVLCSSHADHAPFADAFAAVFAADLPAHVTGVLAAAQRPIAATAFEEPAPVAAWEALPAWYAVATTDQVIHPAAQRFMARRAGAHTVEVVASHAIALAQPTAVAELIRTAAAAIGPLP
jgi:uncharacterized protein with von Willebrand factor type A (vWA) domain